MKSGPGTLAGFNARLLLPGSRAFAGAGLGVGVGDCFTRGEEGETVGGKPWSNRLGLGLGVRVRMGVGVSLAFGLGLGPRLGPRVGPLLDVGVASTLDVTPGVWVWGPF